MKHRALIVDDEHLARVALSALLHERDDVEIVGEAHSVRTAVEQIKACDPDVLFLDVRMRDGSGFDVFDQVSVEAHVVFVSAHGDHALRAFEVNALDYLVKPVQRKHLGRALARAATGIRVPAADAEPKRLTQTDRVCLHDRKSMAFVQLSDIAFLRAARDYTEVHLASGRVALVREPLGSWEVRLPQSLARIHRSLIVNLDFVEELVQREGGWHVRLHTVEELLPISRRLAPSIRERVKR